MGADSTMESGNDLSIGAVCMEAASSPAINVGTICDILADARRSELDLVVFPECAVQGYPLGLGVPDLDQYEYQAAHAEPVSGPSIAAVQRALSGSSVVAVVGLTERGDSDGEASLLFNTVVAVDETGVRTKYRKVHTGGVEKCLWTRGRSFETCAIGARTAGLLICYDLVFPEAARALALRGAELLLMSTAWARADDPTFARGYDLLTRTRALENQVYLVAANLVDGPGGGFHGHSRIVDPTGAVVAETAGAGIARTTICLPADLVRHRARSWFGQVFLRDREPDAYPAPYRE